MQTPKPLAAFVSIPKNASVAIRCILNAGSELIDENHCPLRVVSEKHDLNGVFTFCFSRDPYERVRSWYAYHLKEQRIGDHPDWPYSKFKSLSQWVLAGMPHHWGSQYGSPETTPLNQFNFIRGHRIDFVGRLDRFERDLCSIIAALNRKLGQTKYRYYYLKCN